MNWYCGLPDLPELWGSVEAKRAFKPCFPIQYTSRNGLSYMGAAVLWFAFCTGVKQSRGSALDFNPRLQTDVTSKVPYPLVLFVTP